MEEFPRFSFVCSEIAREDALIAHGLGWFLASQSFLLSGLGIAHAGGVARQPMQITFSFFLPAHGCARMAFEALPSGLKQRYFRGEEPLSGPRREKCALQALPASACSHRRAHEPLPMQTAPAPGLLPRFQIAVAPVAGFVQ